MACCTAWAGNSDAVLIYDAGNDWLITETREHVFTEWDPTATSDLKALRAAFDISEAVNEATPQHYRHLE